MLCEVGKVDDRLTGVVPYPTFLTISGFQAATLAALSASNGWAAETVLLAEPFSPLSESQWISCLSSWLRLQLWSEVLWPPSDELSREENARVVFRRRRTTVSKYEAS